MSIPRAASLLPVLTMLACPAWDINDDGVTRIACAGDANSLSAGPFDPWCTKLGDMLESNARLSSWEVERIAHWASRVVAPDQIHELPELRLVWAAGQLEIAMGACWDENGDGWCQVDREDRDGDGFCTPRRDCKGAAAEIDAIVIAYGTNDTSPEAAYPVEEIVDAYRLLYEMAIDNFVIPYIALVPPTTIDDGEWDATIDQLNMRLRQEFPSELVIDFHTGFAPLLGDDGIHFDEAGHVWRAAVAYRQLVPPELQ